eukprot:849142-Rhodomonas_salina.2
MIIQTQIRTTLRHHSTTRRPIDDSARYVQSTKCLRVRVCGTAYGMSVSVSGCVCSLFLAKRWRMVFPDQGLGSWVVRVQGRGSGV